jgi:hypothetical protein
MAFSGWGRLDVDDTGDGVTHYIGRIDEMQILGATLVRCRMPSVEAGPPWQLDHFIAPKEIRRFVPLPEEIVRRTCAQQAAEMGRPAGAVGPALAVEPAGANGPAEQDTASIPEHS